MKFSQHSLFYLKIGGSKVGMLVFAFKMLITMLQCQLQGSWLMQCSLSSNKNQFRAN